MSVCNFASEKLSSLSPVGRSGGGVNKNLKKAKSRFVGG